MRIRFLSDQVYETDGPGRGPKFTAGQEVAAADVGRLLGRDAAPDWAEGFLRRWINRGVAVVCDDHHPSLAEVEGAETVTPRRGRTFRQRAEE